MKRITRSTQVKRTSRIIQLEGLFDIPVAERSVLEWQVDLPLDSFEWQIGLIVGPSGCGKTTIGRELFRDAIVTGFDWSPHQSIVDDFPKEMSIKDITLLLSSVGFSSPPSWIRPFHVLSNGEQFRVTIARALAESSDLVVVDEFTSVVDRTVAQIGSAAIAKAVRRSDRKFVAITCHYDVAEWLEPDWIYQPLLSELTRGDLRRPEIKIEIQRVHHSAWNLFKRYHYLDASLHPASHCYIGLYQDHPVAFAAVMSRPHPKRPYWAEHRIVCLPDYQGVGIGSAMSNYVASLYAATGKSYLSTTANPAFLRSRAKSSIWNMIRKPSIQTKRHKSGPSVSASWTGINNRMTATFRYTGKANFRDAIEFGLSVRGNGGFP